jgi:hypothetical protein
LRNLTLLVGLYVFAVSGASRSEETAAAARGPQGEEECTRGWSLGDVGLALGGQYRIMGSASNLDFHAAAVEEHAEAASFANQRFRTWLNVHDREGCRYGGYVQFEVGHIFFGEDDEFPKSFASGDDEVGVELRRGYLWYKPSEQSLFRAGILDWQDRFGERPKFEDPMWAVDRYDSMRSPLANSVWDFSVGGVAFEATTREKWHYALAGLFLRAGDRTISGDGGALLFASDVDREVGSSLWGAGVYYLRDRGGYSYGDFAGPSGSGIERDRSWDLWVGIRGHFGAGPARSSVFLIYNHGEIEAERWEHTGWAAKLATELPVRRGTLAVQTVFSSGDDGSSQARSGEFRTIAQSVRDDFGAQSYWSFLGLTSPRGPSDVNDLGVGLQNRGLGLVTVQASWEQTLAADWTGYIAAGWLRSHRKNPANAATAMGTELLGEIQWRMASVLALEMGGSYLMTGDFFKPRTSLAPPDNLHELYVRWQLEF